MLMRRRRQAPFHTEGQTFGEPIDTLRSGLAHEYRRPPARQRPLSKARRMAGPHYLFAFLTSFLTSRGLSPALAPALAPATLPYLVESFPGLALASAAHAGLPLAVAAGSDPGLPGPSVEVGLALVLISARSHLLFAAGLGSALTSARSHLPFAPVVRGGRLARSAGPMVAGWNAGYPAAWNFSPEALPAVPAGKARALLALPAPDSAAALRRHAAGNGNSGCEAPVAAPLGDTDPLNTAAGRQAAGRALEQNGGSNCPIRFDVAPIDCPSARPSAAVHPTATRESTQEDPGSSAPGFAGRTAAQPLGPQAPTARCTRNSRTSCRPGRPSTCHRRRNSSNSVVARSKPGSPAPARVPDTAAG